MRVLKIAGAALAAIIVVLAIAMVVGVPSGFLTSAIQARVERESGLQLTIAGTSRIGLWPTLNVTFNDLTLQDPKQREGSSRVTVGSLKADLTLSSVWSGHPDITELAITKPVVYVPLLRERTRDIAAPPRSPGPSEASDTMKIDRIKVSDGAIVFSNLRDRVEDRIDDIGAEATVGADRRIGISGTARAGDKPLKFDIKAQATASPIAHQNIPVELTLDAPGLLRAPLSAKAQVHFNGAVAMINGVSGTLGDGAFTGWASVDAASKPLVKLDLDFQKLDLASSRTQAASGPQGWSDAPIDLTGLNYVDAQVRLSAGEIAIGDARFAPGEIDATLAGGVLKTTVANLGAYGGQANGEIIVDASNGNPTYAMHCDLVGVRALPLLTSLADFDKIDGKMQARIAARSAGASQHAIMSNLNGTVFANFQDGSIRGINVAQMIRSLTASTLSGWQQQKQETTDLTQLSASFNIDRGQATTTDLDLVGPLVRVTGTGTVDLGSQMLGFRVEPKLVMTTEGQGRTSDPVGLGIPVMIEGPWAAPRIYPDVAGILDNPDAAYAKLRQMGQGLFGANGGLGGLLNSLPGLGGSQGGGTSSDNGGNDANGPLGGQLGSTLGNLIQQGLGGITGNPHRGIDAGPPAPQPQDATPAPAPPPAQNSDPAPSQDSRPMNDVLRQLFNRPGQQ